MNWTKIKTKHFLYSELTKSQKGDLADLLCLTAHLEKMPTETQMLQVCRKPALIVLHNYFKSEATMLQNVLSRVLEDVDEVSKKKEASRLTSERYRKRAKLEGGNGDMSHDRSNHTPDKIREDKKRIYSNKVVVDVQLFELLWSVYPIKLGKKKAEVHFGSSVKTDKDKDDIKKALRSFIRYHKKNETDKQYIPHGSTWFNNWKDWIDYKDTSPKQPSERKL